MTDSFEVHINSCSFSSHTWTYKFNEVEEFVNPNYTKTLKTVLLKPECYKEHTNLFNNTNNPCFRLEYNKETSPGVFEVQSHDFFICKNFININTGVSLYLYNTDYLVEKINLMLIQYLKDEGLPWSLTDPASPEAKVILKCVYTDRLGSPGMIAIDNDHLIYDFDLTFFGGFGKLLGFTKESYVLNNQYSPSSICSERSPQIISSCYFFYILGCETKHRKYIGNNQYIPYSFSINTNNEKAEFGCEYNVDQELKEITKKGLSMIVYDSWGNKCEFFKPFELIITCTETQ